MLDADVLVKTINDVYANVSPASSVLVVQHHDGTAWTSLPKLGPFASATPNDPTISKRTLALHDGVLALAPSGLLTLAFTATDNVAAAQLQSNQWSAMNDMGYLAGISDTTLSTYSGISRYPAIAFRSDNRGVVAWLEQNSQTYQLFVRRQSSATTWESYTGLGLGGDNSVAPERATTTPRSVEVVLNDSDNPMVVWEQPEHSTVNLMYWNGTAWADLHAPITNASSPSIAYRDGAFHLVWESDGEIFYVRRNGTTWDAFPTSSADSVSRTTANSALPSIALDTWGRPIIAWAEGDAANDVGIWALCQRESQWAACSLGSATGIGLATDGRRDYTMSLGVRAGENSVCIHWGKIGGFGVTHRMSCAEL